ncbi:MAG: S8 family serine peptidase, partial [Alphaproteobacteria bacterium]|nr:S8 family serine peptidase [Alphaproteobacteria bacterium]
MIRFHHLAQCAALSAALLLGGCGGNGVSSAPYVPPCPSFPCEAPTAQKLQTPDDMGFENRKEEFENSPEYRPQYRAFVLRDDRHKEQIKASAAYARGATGKGEVVAVNDNYFRPDHREFDVLDENGVRIGSKAAADAQVPINALGNRHGTAISALIAANRDNADIERNMHGVAFDAMLAFNQLIFDDINNHPALRDRRPFNMDVYTEEDDRKFAAQFFNLDYARAAGAGIVNQSFGLADYIDMFPEEQVRAKFKHTAAALEQKGVPPADKIIVVWSAGNYATGCYIIAGQGCVIPVNPTSPEIWAGLGVYFPELREHVLAVVAVGQNGLLEDYSNPCGSAKIFCLAAPGENLTTADSDGRTGYINVGGGTSYSAALVSGSLALLRQYFRDENGARQLGSTELTARLLATANNRGRYSDSDKYGHGLLDLDAATRPHGALATSLSTDPNARPFNPAAFSLSGNAFGGAMRDALGD